jgi:hypothetical protein
VNDDVGAAAGTLVDLQVEFLEEGKHHPEIHPFNDADMPGPVGIDHDPVRFRFPEKNCLFTHHSPPVVASPRCHGLPIDVPGGSYLPLL